MSESDRFVKRVLVIDDERTWLERAVDEMPGREVVGVTTKDEALARCRAQHFDLVISDLLLDREDCSGRTLILALHAENRTSRKLALISAGFSVEMALSYARRLPPEILIRAKRDGVFDSILDEAETGTVPEHVWSEVKTLDDARREHVERLLARLGHNRSEVARHLGVSRKTVVRILDEKRDDTSPPPGESLNDEHAHATRGDGDVRAAVRDR
jgi:ActR/RegA family two-component response regulator